MARVLVVDDEGATRRLVTMTLRLEGHDVVEAPDGRYALKVLEVEGPFDLVVLDLAMPWIDGWAVLRDVPQPGPGVIVVSGVPPSESTESAMQRVDRYIEKPYEPDDLVAAVREVLAGPG